MKPFQSSERGFSLVQFVLAAGMLAAIGGATLPMMNGAVGKSRTFAAAQDISGQVREARVVALTANATIQVRFNCPGPGQYRVIEVTGDGSVDGASRCSAPFPDTDPVALPNNDGPPMTLPKGVSFGATRDLQIGFTGMFTDLNGAVMPATIEVTDGTHVQKLVVSASGAVDTPTTDPK